MCFLLPINEILLIIIILLLSFILLKQTLKENFNKEINFNITMNTDKDNSIKPIDNLNYITNTLSNTKYNNIIHPIYVRSLENSCKKETHKPISKCNKYSESYNDEMLEEEEVFKGKSKNSEEENQREIINSRRQNYNQKKIPNSYRKFLAHDLVSPESDFYKENIS